MDREDHARPRGAGERHRRGGLRPVAVRQAAAARGGARPARTVPVQAEQRPPTTSSRPCTPRRSWPTRRASTRSRRRATSTAGTSTSARWRRSGGRLHHPGPVPRPHPRRVRRRPAHPTLLTDDHFAERARDAQDAWRTVVSISAQLGIPSPGFATALAYYDALRAERLPAALTQAQRDSSARTPTAASTARAPSTPAGSCPTGRRSPPDRCGPAVYRGPPHPVSSRVAPGRIGQRPRPPDATDRGQALDRFSQRCVASDWPGRGGAR